MKVDYDSPADIKVFLEKEGLAMSKRFGQNFLVERKARLRLLGSLEARPAMSVWEIGPGIGAMTEMMLENGLSVTAFEIDYGFMRVLRGLYGDNPRFSLVEGDFLKTWRGRNPIPDRIFGNLPYNAALAIIGDIVENSFLPERMVFTVQKEAARRMAARPGTKDYSAFSVLCSSACSVRILYDIGASSFWPQPRVTSSVVCLSPRPDPVAAGDRKGFSRFVRAAFATRRKTMRNNILAWNPAAAPALAEALEKAGLPQDVRAEALSPEVLASIYFVLPFEESGLPPEPDLAQRSSNPYDGPDEQCPEKRR